MKQRRNNGYKWLSLLLLVSTLAFAWLAWRNAKPFTCPNNGGYIDETNGHMMCRVDLGGFLGDKN